RGCRRDARRASGDRTDQPDRGDGGDRTGALPAIRSAGRLCAAAAPAGRYRLGHLGPRRAPPPRIRAGREPFGGMVAATAAKLVENLDVRRECCWIAEQEGEPIGSVALVNDGDRIA